MALSIIRILRWAIVKAIRGLQQLYPNTMTEQKLEPETRATENPGGSMRDLMEACNQNDRFKLLDDENVPLGDLDNFIHPAFITLRSEKTQEQALKLASLFLTYDSVLVFFVPLLYGRTCTGINSKTTYLSDPLMNASETKRNEYINGVRDALLCLSHSVSLHAMGSEAQVYARTLLSKEKRAHGATCIPVFKREIAVRIEISERLLEYYTDPNGYATATRCAQFRHDFLFATTLVHELVHAFGIMRRGNTNEPHIHANCPETEWGFAWEHFMFGSIINPQQKLGKGTHILMRKAWATSKMVDAAGGKEYCDVSMSYIAQWFRKETWDLIAKNGPAEIPPPHTHFKIQASTKYSDWVVSCESQDIRKDLCTVYLRWKTLAREVNSKVCKIYLRTQTQARLQEFNVNTPVRMMKWTQNYPPKAISGTCKQDLHGPLVLNKNRSVAVCRSFSPDAKPSWKRKADEEIESSCPKNLKQ